MINGSHLKPFLFTLASGMRTSSTAVNCGGKSIGASYQSGAEICLPGSPPIVPYVFLAFVDDLTVFHFQKVIIHF